MKRLDTRMVLACLAVLIVMIFSPWIYLAFPSANPHFVALPFAVGAATAFALMPKGKKEAAIALAVAALLVVPTNIAGHSLAHVWKVGCYD
ncbi:hypothetical protein [Sphingomonas sp. SUN039]|uniref:hypothetical protein n=1 Tax=Sphingomonas sp. SUN039 TaxID=2937787 RepID=UPI0021640320|nr:hypothetical protein [Sphingomonas sp. SUN039]UVO53450.1 hypothetical protein M0209_04690 [Sphingomonas sp. SUN039]